MADDVIVYDEATISGLADLVLATSNEIHFIHFYAMDSNKGNRGHWDTIHHICDDYYQRLQSQYDDVAELALQVGEDVNHPNFAGEAIGFEDSEGTLAEGFEYSQAMDRLLKLLTVLTNYAAEVRSNWDNDSSPAAVAVCNYIEDFIMEWNKECNYRTRRRANSSRLGGAGVVGGDKVSPGGPDRRMQAETIGREPVGLTKGKEYKIRTSALGSDSGTSNTQASPGGADSDKQKRAEEIGEEVQELVEEAGAEATADALKTLTQRPDQSANEDTIRDPQLDKLTKDMQKNPNDTQARERLQKYMAEKQMKQQGATPGQVAEVMQKVSMNERGVPVNDDRWDDEPSTYVAGVAVWIEEGTFSDMHGRHEGYNVKYQHPYIDVAEGMSFDIDTTLEEIEEAVAEAIAHDRERYEDDMEIESARVEEFTGDNDFLYETAYPSQGGMNGKGRGLRTRQGYPPQGGTRGKAQVYDNDGFIESKKVGSLGAAVTQNNLDELKRIAEERINEGRGVDNDSYLDDMTPFMLAVMNDNKPAADILYDFGANIDWQNSDGQTPLHVAAENGNLIMVKWLVMEGADVNAEDKWGVNPRDIAQLEENRKIMWLLEENGAVKGSGFQDVFSPVGGVSEADLAELRKEQDRRGIEKPDFLNNPDQVAASKRIRSMYVPSLKALAKLRSRVQIKQGRVIRQSSTNRRPSYKDVTLQRWDEAEYHRMKVSIKRDIRGMAKNGEQSYSPPDIFVVGGVEGKDLPRSGTSPNYLAFETSVLVGNGIQWKDYVTGDEQVIPFQGLKSARVRSKEMSERDIYALGRNSMEVFKFLDKNARGYLDPEKGTDNLVERLTEFLYDNLTSIEKAKPEIIEGYVRAWIRHRENWLFQRRVRSGGDRPKREDFKSYVAWQDAIARWERGPSHEKKNRDELARHERSEQSVPLTDYMRMGQE